MQYRAQLQICILGLETDASVNEGTNFRKKGKP